MSERPILFSGPMVRAILAGTKTQTRRLMEPQPPDYLAGRIFREIQPWLWGAFASVGQCAACRSDDTINAPYPRGSTMWVRETWAVGNVFDDVSPRALPCDIPVWYRATIDQDREHSINRGRWRPSISTTQWASRITLHVTGVRVERLTDISEHDAIAEGIKKTSCPRSEYAFLWDGINRKRGYPWESNPLVWVISFERTTQKSNTRELATSK